MTLSVYVFGLSAAVLWALTSVLAKRGLESGGSPLLMAFLATVVGSVMFWAILFARTPPPAVFAAFGLTAVAIFLLGGVFATGLGRISNYIAVDRTGASIAKPVSSTHPVIATVLGVVFLNELVSLLQVAGILVVVTGIGVLTFSKGGDVTGWNLRDIVYPLGAAAGFGAGNTVRRFGFVETSMSPMEGLAVNMLGGLGVLAAYIAVRGRGDIFAAPRESYAYFLGASVVTSLGVLSLFAGLNVGNVAIVSTLSGTTPLFVTVFSYLFLRDFERITRGVVAGAGLIVVGVVMIVAL